MLNLIEQQALHEFLEVETPLMRALKKFCREQVERYQHDCSGYMASVPRDPERASDAAAHAEAYATMLAELQHFNKQQQR
jgi:hypothetical protein